ncbi:MAG: PQQ-dependent sugar dehydrogenase [Rhodospirillaceae bacterium]|nr:PQQ-dependent sugar dehydrogenase [Rhodospirillaceae bacterium]
MKRVMAAIVAGFLISSADAQYTIETVAENLELPWSLALLPDGSMLVAERPGRLRIILNGELLEASIAGVPDVYFAGQGGLFDVVPDPDFESNQTIYLSYSHGDRDANATRILRAVLDGNELRYQEVIFTVEPYKRGALHFGGRITFLPDSSLLMPTGDGFTYREDAQKLDTLLGKIVRIHRDGSVPNDNPFAGRDDARPEIWTYGHRNPQAILFDPVSGNVYAHEHGPRGGDELNLIEPGRNYGWPAITYGRDYNYASITPYTDYPGMEQPLVDWTPSIAPAGMTIYRGDLFPDWRGDLFVAALVERAIRRLDMENGQVVGQELLFSELDERMRDVRVGPEGALYLLTDSTDGRVLRVTP